MFFPDEFSLAQSNGEQPCASTTFLRAPTLWKELIAGKEAAGAGVLCADDSVGVGVGVGTDDANFDADTDAEADGEVWEES
jgi:hypothetical protein